MKRKRLVSFTSVQLVLLIAMVRMSALLSVDRSPTGDMLVLLDHQQLDNLLIQAKDGDTAAMPFIIDLFRPAILAAVRHYQTSGIEREDLIQEAVLALIAAIHSYDPLLGVYFTWYATQKIRHAVWSVTRKTRRRAERELLDSGDGSRGASWGGSSLGFGRKSGSSGDGGAGASGGSGSLGSAGAMSAIGGMRSSDGLPSRLAYLADPWAEDAFARVEAELALQTLSENERMIVVRCILDGESISHVAEELEVPVDTAYSWKRRAVRKLRGLLIE